MLRKKGQSVLEYVIVLTAIVAGIVFAINGLGLWNHDSTQGLGKLMNRSATRMTTETAKIANMIQ